MSVMLPTQTQASSCNIAYYAWTII